MSRKHDKSGRSKGNLGLFFAIENFILATPAWRSLSPVARSIYIEIGSLYNQRNNGTLALSARQVAERMPIGRATATRGFKELVTKGFLIACRPSGFNMKTGERKATEWQLTRYKCDVTGALPTKAFTAWRPNNIQNTASLQSQSGFTSAPPPPKIAVKTGEVAPTRSRQDYFQIHDGFTTEPLIDSHHREGATNVSPLNSTPPLITSDGPLKTIGELDAVLPDNLKSWAKLLKTTSQQKLAA